MPVKTMAQRKAEREAELANPSGKGWRNAVPAKRPMQATKMTRSKLYLETIKLYEKIATLELQGTPLDAIALQLRISKKELRRHRGEPMYQSMVKEGVARTEKHLATKLEHLTDRALDVHEEIMERSKKGDPVRLAAATSILDRTLTKPKEAPQEARPVSEHHLHLHADPAEVATVAKRFREAARLAGHLPADSPSASLQDAPTNEPIATVAERVAAEQEKETPNE